MTISWGQFPVVDYHGIFMNDSAYKSYLLTEVAKFEMDNMKRAFWPQTGRGVTQQMNAREWVRVYVSRSQMVLCSSPSFSRERVFRAYTDDKEFSIDLVGAVSFHCSRRHSLILSSSRSFDKVHL